MLASEATGSGIPILFLHAFPLSKRLWDINKPVLSKNFHFITVDLPGFGDSPLSFETSTMESMASQVLEALDHLKVNDRCIIGGLSMGGYVMLQLLRLAPERFRAAAFFSTRAGADSDQTKERRFQTIELIKTQGMGAFAKKTVPALLGKSTLRAPVPMLGYEVQSWIESAKPESVCAALRGMAARPDSTNVLKELKIPALFLAGEEDAVIPPSEMEEISKYLPKSEFHVFPGAGHLINLEQPVLFQDAFLHFLKSKVL